ncbi:MAG: MBOAT family protein [Bacteroidales bacterium]|nr:MBOAT family protein [Bacteroidales bacterium]
MLLFSDITFWLVFIFFLAIYAFVRRYSRMGMVLYVTAFSLLFFYLANGWMMLLLPAVALVAWCTGRVLAGIHKGADSAPTHSWKDRLMSAVAVIVILSPLLYFKYTNFFLSSLNTIIASNFSLLNMALPIGISFFTFQAISYVVDVYRGRFTMKVSFLEFLFYLSFFPLLLAGPITRAQTLLPQIRKPAKVSERCLYMGLWLVMIGLLKKCVIADYISQYNDWVFSSPITYSGFECVMGILGYTVQIYCDFSGYSDISIGIAAMMGFHLPENFSFPYSASSPSEFWHRWHISLSTWFRDYIYIPMGGNRCSRVRTYLNNFITMLVAGLWHGSTWMFVLWGGIHGLGLVLHKVCKPWLNRLPDSRWLNGLAVIFTFIFVAVAWVFFRIESVTSACQLLSRSVTDFDIAYIIPFVKARSWWCVLTIVPLAAQAIGRRGFLRLQARFILLPWIVKLLIFVLVIQLILQFQTSNVQPFIYYQF